MSTLLIRSQVKTNRASGNVITQTCQQPAYAASLAITPDSEDCIVAPGQLTGALTLTIVSANSLIGDKVKFYFAADATNRVVTFSTGFVNTNTLTVLASGYGFAEFEYNGTSWVAKSISSGATTAADIQTPAYTATLSVTTTARATKLMPAQLTGAMTINMVTTSAQAGDIIHMIFGADGTNRVVTFGTGLKSSGTMTVIASKFGGIQFMYDGTEWVAMGREITA